MAEKLNLPDKEICDKYLDGMSTPKLAKEVMDIIVKDYWKE